MIIGVPIFQHFRVILWALICTCVANTLKKELAEYRGSCGFLQILMKEYLECIHAYSQLSISKG